MVEQPLLAMTAQLAENQGLLTQHVQLFPPFPLSASTLRCVCVLHSLSLLAQGCSQWKRTHWVEDVVTSCFCLVFDFPARELWNLKELEHEGRTRQPSTLEEPTSLETSQDNWTICQAGNSSSSHGLGCRSRKEIMCSARLNDKETSLSTRRHSVR